MFKLTEKQWAALCELEERNFVESIRDDIVRVEPALAGDSTLLERLVKARQWAQKAGLGDGQAMTEFLYLEAGLPGFYLKPAVAAWLRKSGAPAEERFRSLLGGVRRERKNMKEKKPWQV